MPSKDRNMRPKHEPHDHSARIYLLDKLRSSAKTEGAVMYQSLAPDDVCPARPGAVALATTNMAFDGDDWFREFSRGLRKIIGYRE
jgi:hypothetical protein